jgi:hypothetical protein
MHPEVKAFGTLSDTARLIVSEALRDIPGAWEEVPEAHWGVMQPGGRGENHPFRPRWP